MPRNIDIDDLNESELMALNERVVERLRLFRQAQAQMAMLQFNVGDRVSFQSDGGSMVCGALVRHNEEPVTLRGDGGGHWRVSPSFLRAACKVEMQRQTLNSATVIRLPRKP